MYIRIAIRFERRTANDEREPIKQIGYRGIADGSTACRFYHPLCNTIIMNAFRDANEDVPHVLRVAMRR